MTVQDLTIADELRAEADRLIASGATGRSGVMRRLFEFLLERSVAGETPKEIEVAVAVFGKEPGFDAMQDASVRVYIHRLRRRLDEHYSGQPPGENRLFIPKGEYRLAIARADLVPPVAPEPDIAEIEIEPDPAPPRRTAGPRLWAALAGMLLVVSIAGWLIVLGRRDADPTREAIALQPWAALAASRSPTFVVLGDYYIFGETDAAGQLSHLTREFAVNSREDLDQFLMFNPDRVGRSIDLDLHYLPLGASLALHTVDPIVRAAGAGGAGALRVVTTSAINASVIKSANVVYLGYLSGLGSLATPALGASNFEIGGSYDELIDSRTGKHYASDWSTIVDAKTPTRDYAYFASIPAPSGTRMLIVAGTRDGGVMQAAEIATDPDELRLIAAKTGGAEAFEAVYEVQTLGNTNLGSKLIAAYPLRTNRTWQDAPTSSRQLPDRMPATR